MWRLTYHPDTDTIDSPVPLDASLAGIKADALALSPDGSALFVGSLVDGGIRRINNLLDPNTRNQTVDVIAQTTDGRGINGSIAFLGNDLYLPENRGLSVMQNAPGCSGCTATLLNLPGVAVAASVATDNAKGTVYVAVAPGAANATIYRYKPSGGGSVIYATRGQLPPEAATPTYTEDCTQTCQRVPEPGLPSDGVVGFHFPLGLYVDPNTGNLIVLDDPAAGVRGFHGHVFSVPFTP